MDTFDDTQRPFPLFKAPIAHAALDGPGECVRCGKHVGTRFQDACYDCFRTGELDTVMDTEFGMVTRDDATAGRTHGIPLNDPSALNGYTLTQHPIDPRFPDDRWYHVHIDPGHLAELLRTPKYHTWQGETWLFCCQRPMVFRGSLPADIFTDDPDLLPSEIEKFLDAPDWKQTVEDGHGSHTYYVFTCSVCGALRHHDDCD
ncbi:MAG: CbrC family protein [Pirellulaceae bacterium]|nr:CbrC family protein [Planctomycetales bacterium]